jgi:hypothetical protein
MSESVKMIESIKTLICHVGRLINISGLAIGLACALSIGLFIQDQYSCDRFHRHEVISIALSSSKTKPETL